MFYSELNGMLITAIQMGDMDKVIEQLERGANAKIVNAMGETPLHFAVYHDRIAILQYLVRLGVDVNAQTNDGETPIFYAAETGKTEMAIFLLENGADPSIKSIKGHTPLEWAKLNDKENVAESIQAFMKAKDERLALDCEVAMDNDLIGMQF